MLRLALIGVAAGALCGCGHFNEHRTVSAFVDALENDDLDGLKSSASDDFQLRAMRHAEALKDFEVLRVPTGETSVVSVKEESDTEKLVTVATGSSGRNVRYRLVKHPVTSKWVVDDVYLRQRKNGVKVDRSVAEQMDLLISVREFLAAWGGGDRDQALTAVTPDFADVLRDLPMPQFERLRQNVAGENGTKMKSRPKAQLDGDAAIVSLSRPTGKMLLSCRLNDGVWRVSDVAVESKKDNEHVSSAKKTAVAMRAAIEFLTAYSQNDKARLKTLCEQKLFERGISPGELSRVPLPDASLPGCTYYVKMLDTMADFVIQRPQDLIRITMSKQADENRPDKLARYFVRDVTIFDSEPGSADVQEKRLSVVFTGKAVMELFRRAVAAKNMPMIRSTSTRDFNDRVWSKISPEDLASTIPAAMRSPRGRVLGTKYQGAVNYVSVDQGGTPVVYVLRDHRGNVRVDNVRIGTDADALSMKDTMEMLLPVRAFAKALAASDLGSLQRHSSKNLNNIVWKQAEGIPQVGKTAIDLLRLPLAEVKHAGEGRHLVTLGDERFGCKVLLVDEHAKQVIDDIVLIRGVLPEQRVVMKKKMREQVALGLATNLQKGLPRTLDAKQVADAKPLPRPPATREQLQPPVFIQQTGAEAEAFPATRPAVQEEAVLQPIPIPTRPQPSTSIAPSESAFDLPE